MMILNKKTLFLILITVFSFSILLEKLDAAQKNKVNPAEPKELTKYCKQDKTRSDILNQLGEEKYFSKSIEIKNIEYQYTDFYKNGYFCAFYIISRANEKHLLSVKIIKYPYKDKFIFKHPD